MLVRSKRLAAAQYKNVARLGYWHISLLNLAGPAVFRASSQTGVRQDQDLRILRHCIWNEGLKKQIAAHTKEEPLVPVVVLFR
jgi:hypothetical protein